MKERMMRRLESTYEYFMGNSKPQKARVVCIGEIHPFVIHFGQKERIQDGTREAVDNLIATIARPGDILLIERHASMQIADESVLQELEHSVPSWLTVYGWDDMALRRKAHAYVDESLRQQARESTYRGSADFADLIRPRRSASAALWERAYIIAMERNATLELTIQEAEKRLHKGNKVIVIAGADHFTEDAHTHKFLRKYRFAILVPKKI